MNNKLTYNFNGTTLKITLLLNSRIHTCFKDKYIVMIKENHYKAYSLKELSSFGADYLEYSDYSKKQYFRVMFTPNTNKVKSLTSIEANRFHINILNLITKVNDDFSISHAYIENIDISNINKEKIDEYLSNLKKSLVIISKETEKQF